MEIVDNIKFGIGVVFALIGVAVLFTSRGSRGFNERRQAGALFLVGSLVFGAVGLGYLDL